LLFHALEGAGLKEVAATALFGSAGASARACICWANSAWGSAETVVGGISSDSGEASAARSMSAGDEKARGPSTTGASSVRDTSPAKAGTAQRKTASGAARTQ